MSEHNEKSLVKLQGGELTGKKKRTNSAIKHTTKDVLNEATAQGISQATHRIGEYEFREPDYNQICFWAQHFEKSEEDLIRIFSGNYFNLLQAGLRLDALCDMSLTPISFNVVDGSIIELSWPYPDLPSIPDHWEPGLAIKRFQIRPIIDGDKIHITHLDVSCLPSLTELCCRGTLIKQLKLSGLSELRVLDCSANDLEALDLSGLIALEFLDCSTNDLNSLEFIDTPILRVIDCKGNKLTSLDISGLPQLRILICSKNQISEIDCLENPALKTLACPQNKLKEINLKNLEHLENLIRDQSCRVLGIDV